MPVLGRFAEALLAGGLLASACIATCTAAFAREDPPPEAPEVDWRPGYSSISLGASFTDYEERTRIAIDGRDVDVDTELGAIATQTSTAFVAIDRRWGFYLSFLATLGTSSSSERWAADGATVRDNRIALEQQAIALLGARRVGAAGQILFGIRYANTEFKRFAGRLTPEAAELGVTAQTFANGTVSETAWDVGVQVGYERGTLFGRDTRGWQYRWQATVGVPLVTSYADTEIDEGRAFVERFDGHEFRVYALVGYRLGEHFLIGADLEASLRRRGGVDGRSFGDGTLTAFPSSTTVTVIPSLGAYWSF